MVDSTLILMISIGISLFTGILIGYMYAKEKNKNYEDSPSLSNNKQPVGAGISSDKDSDILRVRETLMNKLEQLRREVGLDFISLAFYDFINSEIRWRLAVGATNTRYKKIVIRLGKGIAGEVVQLNRTIKIENYPHDVIGDPIEYPILLVEHLKCAIAVPVADDLRIYGVLLAGHREQRKFTQEIDEKLKATGKELAKELAIANVYTQIRNEKTIQSARHGQIFIHDSSFVQFLNRMKEQLPEQKRGKLNFEVLDQSIVELPEHVQQVLVNNMERVLLIISKEDSDRANISISREESNLLIESESNHPLSAEDDAFSKIYQSIGEIGGSVISYHEEEHSHLIIQIPVWGFSQL